MNLWKDDTFKKGVYNVYNAYQTGDQTLTDFVDKSGFGRIECHDKDGKFGGIFYTGPKESDKTGSSHTRLDQDQITGCRCQQRCMRSAVPGVSKGGTQRSHARALAPHGLCATCLMQVFPLPVGVCGPTRRLCTSPRTTARPCPTPSIDPYARPNCSREVSSRRE